uniref:Putative isopenicillin N synthase-like protein n=1 Tax=Helianthus annuus TaxID=4232 RepID=A0A251VBG1_HELAN
MISGRSRRNVKGYLKNISVYCGGFRKKITEKFFYLHFAKKLEGYPEHPVNPLDPSLLIIVLITNDKFVSSQHKVVANKVGPRVSVASFFTTGVIETSKVYGPINELLSEEKMIQPSIEVQR